MGPDERRLDAADGLNFGQADGALIPQGRKRVTTRSKSFTFFIVVHVRHFGALECVLDLVNERRSDPAGQNDQKQERRRQTCLKFGGHPFRMRIDSRDGYLGQAHSVPFSRATESNAGRPSILGRPA